MGYGYTAALKTCLLGACLLSIGGCAADPSNLSPASRPAAGRVRYQVDAAAGRVWFLTRDGLFLLDVSRPERIRLPLPGWRWTDTPRSCPPDVALGPSGEAVVTSNSVATLWRIDPETLTVSVHPIAVEAVPSGRAGFSSLVFAPRRGAFVATLATDGSRWSIDPELTSARRIPFAVLRICGHSGGHLMLALETGRASMPSAGSRSRAPRDVTFRNSRSSYG